MRTLYGTEGSEMDLSSGEEDEEELVTAHASPREERDRAAGSAGPAREEMGRQLALLGRPATPASSTIGNESVFQGSATIEQLEQVMARPFDMAEESAKKYARRQYRLVDALSDLGENVLMAEVERRVARALYEEKIQDGGRRAAVCLERILP